MVYGLAAQSGGVARISSRVGAGTTVELLLPVADAGALQRPGPAPAQAAGPTRACSILLVDDDRLVAESTAAMLQHLGHRVLVAASGAQALGVIRGETKLDLVITDHAMPGMTGMELAKHIRQIAPGLQVILATGYAELLNSPDPTIPRLDKPYRLDALASILSSVMGPDTVAPPRPMSGTASA